MSNLVANAIKFTNHGHVHISLALDEESRDEVILKLVVEDTGIGVPANKYHEIFEQFAKLNASYQGIYKGSGLGLFSVKQYVGQMQGRIDVDSIVGKGTKFIITLPFDKAASAQTVQLPINHELSQTVAVLNTTSCEVTQINTSLNKKRKILVVEDSPLPARAVMRLLGDYDCEIKLVESGEAAVKAAVNKRYDLILMDIGLPGIDGIEATRRIRHLPDHAKTPIVALTGHIRGHKKTDCITAGMQDVLSKPLTRHQLKSLFKTYIDQESDASDMTGLVDKQVLDIQTMLAHYGMVNPAQAVDILTTTIAFIPEKLVELKLAVAKEDIAAIKILIQELKGALAYVIAPEANELLTSLDNVLNYESLTKLSLTVMYDAIHETLSILLKAIHDLLAQLT